MINTFSFNKLFQTFINQSFNKKRRTPSGGVISKSTTSTYQSLKVIIDKYQAKRGVELEINDIRKGSKKEIEQQKRYWKRFYSDFSDFMYKDLGHFDTYVGHNYKMLRAFFNWVNREKSIDTGMFYKNFYVPKEEIPILTLEPEQLQFLIRSKEFENKLSKTLLIAKDVFVFGCAVTLRYSDLFKLKKSNLEIHGNKHYLRVVSQKTNTKTRILLPDYAVKIIEKYRNQTNSLLPVPPKVLFNQRIKRFLELAGWTKEYPKVRMKWGKPVKIKRKNGKPYRFCDHFCTHSMRRTGITTLLRLGLEENLVRKVSGHAAGSKEFYKYVYLSQSFMDEELTDLYAKFEKK